MFAESSSIFANEMEKLLEEMEYDEFNSLYEEYIFTEKLKFKDEKDFKDCYPNEQYSRVTFLCDEFLDIITYSSDASYEIGAVFLEVISAILNKSSHKYIYKPQNEINFLYVVNILMLKGYRINWGTNIYGCWFEDDRELFERLVRFVKGR